MMKKFFILQLFSLSLYHVAMSAYAIPGTRYVVPHEIFCKTVNGKLICRGLSAELFQVKSSKKPIGDAEEPFRLLKITSITYDKKRTFESKIIYSGNHYNFIDAVTIDNYLVPDIFSGRWQVIDDDEYVCEYIGIDCYLRRW